MKNRPVFSAFSPAIATVLLLLTVSPATAAGQSADEFIRGVGEEAIASLTGKDLSRDQRQARFREILNRTFEVRLIARFTLGRYWRRASEEQKQAYVSLFEDFIVQAYAARFANYNGEKFTVGKVREIDNSEDALVQSELSLQDGRTIVVYWRVRGNNEYKVIDVIVEGVSMAITQRDEFAAIINQNGGKVDGLIAALRRKTGK